MRESNPFTILEYIKTSIEILMNMKMEEHQEMRDNAEGRRKRSKGKKNRSFTKEDAGDDSAVLENADSESVLSSSGAPSEYEQMLQKYEAEVRNHIKIEQQLKLHIECVQDKLEDNEKLLKKETASKDRVSSESELELKRYKDLLGLREKEISSLKSEMDHVKTKDDSLKKRVSELEREKNDLNMQMQKQ